MQALWHSMCVHGNFYIWLSTIIMMVAQIHLRKRRLTLYCTRIFDHWFVRFTLPSVAATSSARVHSPRSRHRWSTSANSGIRDNSSMPNHHRKKRRPIRATKHGRLVRMEILRLVKLSVDSWMRMSLSRGLSSRLYEPNVADLCFQETSASMHDECTSRDHSKVSTVRGTMVWRGNSNDCSHLPPPMSIAGTSDVSAMYLSQSMRSDKRHHSPGGRGYRTLPCTSTAAIETLPWMATAVTEALSYMVPAATETLSCMVPAATEALPCMVPAAREALSCMVPVATETLPCMVPAATKPLPCMVPTATEAL